MNRDDLPTELSESVRLLLSVPDMTANVADVLSGLKIGSTMGDGLSPLRRGQKICGPALTVRYREFVEGRDDKSTGLGDKPVYLAARPGDIAVVECPHPRAAVLGAVSARWAQLAGLGGVVIDGAVRDTATISQSELAVWALARTPVAGIGHVVVESIGELIQLHGNAVHPGDIVVADDDGLAVIPVEYLDEVVRRCVQAQAVEEQTLALIDRCASVAELSAALAGESTHP